MNEELQKALAESVKLAMEGLKQGKDFVVAQAPDVIQQLLKWRYYEALTFAVVWAGIVFLCLIVAYLTHRTYLKKKAKGGYYDDSFMVGYGALIPAAIGTFVAIPWNIMTMVQITVAPKIYLIEWAVAQLKAK